MSVVLVVAVGWFALALAVGLLLGGAVKLDERAAATGPTHAEPVSGPVLEGALDGEGHAGTLQVDEESSPVL